jgi:hypothetical protein
VQPVVVPELSWIHFIDYYIYWVHQASATVWEWVGFITDKVNSHTEYNASLKGRFTF